MPSPAEMVAALLLSSLKGLAAASPRAAKERHQAMGRDPSSFVRGCLLLHAAWLADHPLPEAPWVWSVGDAHAGNFATLANGPLGRLGYSPVTYGVADVDDEHPAPWHWDLVRLLASLAVAVPDLTMRTFPELALGCLADYLRVMLAAADDDEHASRIDFHGLPEALKTAIERDAQEQHRTGHLRRLVAGRRLRPGEESARDPAMRTLLLPAVRAALGERAPGRDWEVLDLARRTAGGLGSLGRRRWWVLARERDRAGDWSPRLLELKERRPSALAAFLPVHPFAPLPDTRWTLPMGGDPWQRIVPLGAGEALLRTRCHARTVLDPATLDAGDRLRLVRLWGQLLAVAHLTSAAGIGQPARGVAAVIANHAHAHAATVGMLAWELARWTRDAHRAFAKYSPRSRPRATE
jgi:hypothetical protein